MFFLRFRCPLLLVPLLAACVAEPTQPPAGAYGPLRLEATFAQGEIVVGDTTSLVVTLRNPTDTVIVVPFASACQLLPFLDRVDPRHPWHPAGSVYDCPPTFTALRIGPGDSWTQTLLVCARADLSPPSYNTPGITVTPGRYEGFAVLNVNGTGGRAGPRSSSAELVVRR